MINLRDIFGITVVGLAATFMGACLYYDRKRRLDPLYSKKAEARRFLQQEECLIEIGDYEKLTPEHKFLHQVQLGEARILCGDIEEGVRNLKNAVFICNRPIRLLQVMQGVLSEEIFAKLVLQVEETRQQNIKMAANSSSQFSMNQQQHQQQHKRNEQNGAGIPAYELFDKLSYSISGTDCSCYGGEYV